MLQWTPLFNSIIDTGSQCNLMIAPFIQANALKRLLEHFDTTKLQVITSWTASSLINGASDPDAYDILKGIDVPLYIHPDIHLKLFVFQDDIAFHTSANVTARGLGLIPQGNTEIGCRVKLELSDWLRINELLANSRRVTDEIQSKAKHYIEENKGAMPPLPDLVLADWPVLDSFSRQSLPHSSSPNDLWTYYSSGELSGNTRGALAHDLWLYKIKNAQLPKEEFFQLLGENFRSHPFIKALVNLLQEKQTLHFGAVNAWITSNCSDRPTPSRWEIKPATNRVYRWLDEFYEPIECTRPHYSQLLHWR